MTIKNCANCCNTFERSSNAEKYCPACKFVIKENKKLLDQEYKKNNKEKINQQNKEYRENNREEIRIRDRILYSNNRVQRISKAMNSPNRKLNKRNSQARRRKDPIFKIHQNISFAVNKAIKRNGSIKGDSIVKYLPYTIQELKEHLERQFEPWMNWNNWGSYNRETWDDSNYNTWKWNIDHIIPKSSFYYTSMGDENFRKCWALGNLRPYSAKQNVMDQDDRKTQ